MLFSKRVEKERAVSLCLLQHKNNQDNKPILANYFTYQKQAILSELELMKGYLSNPPIHST